MHHFIGNLGEEGPFNYNLGEEGPFHCNLGAEVTLNGKLREENRSIGYIWKEVCSLLIQAHNHAGSEFCMKMIFNVTMKFLLVTL